VTPKEYAAKYKLDPKSVRRRLRALYGKAGDGSHTHGTAWQLTPAMIVALGNPTAKRMTRSTEPAKHRARSSIRDEAYIVGLCDRLLGEKAQRQYRGFSFLAGDAGTPLPVDAYYPGHRLVIEYHERQHFESVPFWDKPPKQTVSGVHRGEQRRIYDARRRATLPQHGIALIELKVEDFKQNSQKRLLRSKKNDVEVLKRSLAKFL